jgi:hypothetical protein
MKKNKLKLLKLAVLFVTITALFSGCYEREEIALKKDTLAIDTSDPLYQYIINDLGFRPEDVSNRGSMYVVEGDILFNKEQYSKAGYASGRTAQTTSRLFVSRPNQNDITISVDSNIPNSGNYNWRPHIVVAVGTWNSVTCSNIRFRFVTSGGDIHIKGDGGELEDDELGAAPLPVNGQPGNYIHINSDLLLNSSQKITTIIHELGHTVGFVHTDWIANGESLHSPHLVPGTTDTDNASIMNHASSANSFSPRDLVAIRNVYPSLSDAPCQAPLYRYYSHSKSDHFYTTEFAEGGRGMGTYEYTWIECHIHLAQVNGSIPLYRYWNKDAKDHFYTTNFNELGNGKYGYVYERVEGYVYSTQVAGTVPLLRYYNPGATDHLYTVDPNELGGGAHGFEPEGITGYVYP